MAVASDPSPAKQTEAPVNETEQSDIAVLPPPTPHRVLVGGTFQGIVRVFDGDTGHMLGQIYTAPAAVFTLDPNNQYYYVAETTWSRGNRGMRADLLSVYDQQLKLVSEIPLPGLVVAGPRSATLGISGDGHFAYAFNFQPASSVAVVDLSARKVTAIVEIPGCAMIYPWASAGFTSLCADGRVANVTYKKGRYEVTHSEKFFDAELDPVFDDSVVDRTAQHAWFLSYTGLVYDAQLGEHFVVNNKWSLQEAAGEPPATTKPRELAWRPGGAHVAAYHKAGGRLYVLMHVGTHWTHKQPGTEVWVFDTSQHARVARITLPSPADAIAISQDPEPLLFALSGEDANDPSAGLTVIKADTGEVTATVKGIAGTIAAVMGL